MTKKTPVKVLESVTGIRVGQYWKHDNGFSGTSIWLVKDMSRNSEGLEVVLIELISDSVPSDQTLEGDSMAVGEDRSYYVDSMIASWWKLIDKEDLPLHLLGAL